MPVTYTCLIIDDEPLARELIEAYVSKIPELKIAGQCTNALEASSLLTKQKVDLLFLDINMPVLKGVDFFKNLVTKPEVIFTTAHREYALEGFEVNALDYLLKPIIFDRFFLSVQKFFKAMETKVVASTESPHTSVPRETLIVTQGQKKIRLYKDEIVYVESFKDYIEIHTVHKKIRIKQNIGAFERKLGLPFLRIHRSYIVHTIYLTGFSKNEVEIKDLELPIGNSYKEKVLTYFETSGLFL
ncbi:response regulator transcription factor [Aquimarina sp. ERC-38]|uniref:LytR/AlgR family response regulator transcription factor n=1 Tax=Aquimarina sp. ERC-38 TaxID=2949996 RepID=UPI002247687C|nr:response regulator transcription factor [Aquimarina sp. ERC-38]UZO80076.1 response regulator transcription factor [Aquimarina sp. ERC-38]